MFVIILEQNSTSPESVAKECCFQERHHPAPVGHGCWDTSAKCHTSYARQCSPSQ